MGQTVPVTVFKYTAIGTIEERIHQILTAKQVLFDEIVDDVSLDLASRLTSDEIFGLFGLDRPSDDTPRGRPGDRPGLDFEQRCARILTALGWRVERTPLSRDGGVDLVASKMDEVGIESRLYVQCKDHARAVGVEVVRQLLGVLPNTQVAKALVAARSGLTADAARLARERDVIVWDEARIAELEKRV